VLVELLVGGATTIVRLVLVVEVDVELDGGVVVVVVVVVVVLLLLLLLLLLLGAVLVVMLVRLLGALDVVLVVLGFVAVVALAGALAVAFAVVDRVPATTVATPPATATCRTGAPGPAAEDVGPVVGTLLVAGRGEPPPSTSAVAGAPEAA
jgi:hypothetical protein